MDSDTSQKDPPDPPVALQIDSRFNNLLPYVTQLKLEYKKSLLYPPSGCDVYGQPLGAINQAIVECPHCFSDVSTMKFTTHLFKCVNTFFTTKPIRQRSTEVKIKSDKTPRQSKVSTAIGNVPSKRLTGNRAGGLTVSSNSNVVSPPSAAMEHGKLATKPGPKRRGRPPLKRNLAGNPIPSAVNQHTISVESDDVKSQLQPGKPFTTTAPPARPVGSLVVMASQPPSSIVSGAMPLSTDQHQHPQLLGPPAITNQFRMKQEYIIRCYQPYGGSYTIESIEPSTRSLGVFLDQRIASYIPVVLSRYDYQQKYHHRQHYHHHSLYFSIESILHASVLLLNTPQQYHEVVTQLASTDPLHLALTTFLYYGTSPTTGLSQQSPGDILPSPNGNVLSFVIDPAMLSPSQSSLLFQHQEFRDGLVFYPSESDTIHSYDHPGTPHPSANLISHDHLLRLIMSLCYRNAPLEYPISHLLPNGQGLSHQEILQHGYYDPHHPPIDIESHTDIDFYKVRPQLKINNRAIARIPAILYATGHHGHGDNDSHGINSHSHPSSYTNNWSSGAMDIGDSFSHSGIESSMSSYDHFLTEPSTNYLGSLGGVSQSLSSTHHEGGHDADDENQYWDIYEMMMSICTVEDDLDTLNPEMLQYYHQLEYGYENPNHVQPRKRGNTSGTSSTLNTTGNSVYDQQMASFISRFAITPQHKVFLQQFKSPYIDPTQSAPPRGYSATADGTSASQQQEDIEAKQAYLKRLGCLDDLAHEPFFGHYIPQKIRLRRLPDLRLKPLLPYASGVQPPGGQSTPHLTARNDTSEIEQPRVTNPHGTPLVVHRSPRGSATRLTMTLSHILSWNIYPRYLDYYAQSLLRNYYQARHMHQTQLFMLSFIIYNVITQNISFPQLDWILTSSAASQELFSVSASILPSPNDPINTMTLSTPSTAKIYRFDCQLDLPWSADESSLARLRRFAIYGTLLYKHCIQPAIDDAILHQQQQSPVLEQPLGSQELDDHHQPASYHPQEAQHQSPAVPRHPQSPFVSFEDDINSILQNSTKLTATVPIFVSIDTDALFNSQAIQRAYISTPVSPSVIPSSMGGYGPINSRPESYAAGEASSMRTTIIPCLASPYHLFSGDTLTWHTPRIQLTSPYHSNSRIFAWKQPVSHEDPSKELHMCIDPLLIQFDKRSQALLQFDTMDDEDELQLYLNLCYQGYAHISSLASTAVPASSGSFSPLSPTNNDHLQAYNLASQFPSASDGIAILGFQEQQQQPQPRPQQQQQPQSEFYPFQLDQFLEPPCTIALDIIDSFRQYLVPSQTNHFTQVHPKLYHQLSTPFSTPFSFNLHAKHISLYLPSPSDNHHDISIDATGHSTDAHDSNHKGYVQLVPTTTKMRAKQLEEKDMKRQRRELLRWQKVFDKYVKDYHTMLRNITSPTILSCHLTSLADVPLISALMPDNHAIPQDLRNTTAHYYRLPFPSFQLY